jgi:acetoin utilization deacetylase AcuC-like enzyme
LSITGFLTSDRYLDHDPGWGHPERPQRIEAIWNRLDKGGLIRELVSLEPRPAERAWVRAVHSLKHLDLVEEAQKQARRQKQAVWLDPDTACGPDSYDIALLAAGGVLEAVDAVMEGRVEKAFCAVRPPGHHAEPERPMGFCLLNNVAIAARYLVEKHGLGRVMIFDWDSHHGNGTQAAFARDPAVIYASLHQFPHYPGTGLPQEKGIGPWEGTMLNIPMEPGAGDEEHLEKIDDLVAKMVEETRPDFFLVSAGFDGDRKDPLCGMNLTREGYEQMTRRVCDWAGHHAGGRVVSVLEGGYNLEDLASSVEGHLQVMLASD